VFLVRYLPNGLPDFTFGTAGDGDVNASLGFTVTDLALQSDGKLVVAGTKGDLIHNNLQIAVARFLENGTLDPAFGSGGQVAVGTGLESGQITIQGNDKILVAGMTLSMGATIQSLVVARLNSDGTTDTAFGANGIASTFISGDAVPVPRGLGIEPNGRIVVATSSELVGFASNGILDAGLGMNGVSKAPTNVSIRGLTISGDGRIIAVGTTNQGGTADFAIMRFFPNGILDVGFGTNGETFTDFSQSEEANAVAVQFDGRYVAAGSTVNATANSSDFALARYNPNGSLDDTFGTGGKVITPFGVVSQAFQVLVQPNGKAVAAGGVGGSFANSGGNFGFALARYIADTPLPTANQCFVAKAYLDLLGRPVDGVGLAQWSNMLDQGTTRTQVALSIESSSEFARYTVNSLYAQYLHRAVDSSGLNTSENFLQAGGSIEQLIEVLVSSPEFIQIQGHGTHDGFLDALYQDALNRAVDPGGRATWDLAFANGATYAQVAAAILASQEYRQDIVELGYEHFLRREAEPAGLNAFTAMLDAGARDQQVYAMMVGSEEYFQRV
jgi:uncharacterized delta-60 repeat protein